MNYYWSLLDIAPTNDLKAIKRAYATQLKKHRPEDNAEHFQRLREAYEWACHVGVHRQFAWRDDDIDETFVEHDNDYENAKEQPESIESARSVAQSLPLQATILASVPTHFPTTFQPPPSPTFPVIAPELQVQVEAKADVVYVQSATQPSPRMRSITHVIAAFRAQSRQSNTISDLQFWLQAQPEFESLQMRPNLEDALAEAFTERLWPWPAVLAVAELLDWGTIGNLLGAELNQAVQLALLQQRAAITSKPRWYQILSKTAAAYFLLSPFSWPKTLFSALLPRTQQIDELCDEIGHAGLKPSQVYNPKQIEFQRNLRRIDFNKPRLAYALTRLVGWPLFFSLFFASVDTLAPLVGLTFGLLCFALWASYVSNRLLFRMIWTPSPSSIGPKSFWLGIGITLAIAGICEALAWPNFAPLLAGFMLFAVAKNKATAMTCGALVAFVALLTTLIIWPTKAAEKFAIVAAIELSMVAIGLYFYQRQLPRKMLLETLLRPPLRLNTLATPQTENFHWWWIVVAIALLRLFGSGH